MRLVVCVVMVLTACGDNGDGRPEIETNADNVCRQIGQVACHDLYNCCTESEIEGFLGVRVSRRESECVDDVHRLCLRRIGDLDFAVAQGHVVFDNDAMDVCLESLLAPDTCTAVGENLPWDMTCKDIVSRAWVGTVPTGGDCFLSAECMGDESYCAADLRCRARPGPGSPCGTGCASNAFCRNNLCVARLAAGNACTSTSDCIENLFCDVSGASGVCTAMRDAGHPCRFGAACKSGVCLPGVCAGSGQQCHESSQCYDYCADDGSPCFSAGDCSANGSIACLPPSCIGDIVCAIEHVTTDFCVDAVSAATALIDSIPVPPGQ